MKGKVSTNISILRILATVAVIFIHECSTLTYHKSEFYLSDSQYIFLKCIHDLAIWSVPVFFMITGILLLDEQKELSMEICLKKYCFRVLLVLILFGVSFAVIKLAFDGEEITGLLIFKGIIKMVEGDGFQHLWYLYTLLGIYLILPVLKVMVKNLAKRELLIFMIIVFLFDFLFPFLGDLLNIDIAFGIPIKYPIFYLILGYSIKNKVIKWSNKICIIILVCASGFIIIGDLYIVNWMDAVVSYDSPIIALFATAFVTLTVNNSENIQSGKWVEMLWTLDRLCFGVYLVHPIFIHFTYRVLKITPMDFKYGGVAVFGMLIFFSVISFAVSWMMSLIKPLKKYVL